MLAVLSITAPIFILIGLGFFSARIGLVNREQARGMGVFVIHFALPALVFKALAERSLGEVLNWPYLAAYALASLSLFGFGLLLAWRWRGQSLSSSAILAMGMSVPNSAFIGYSIAVMVTGPTAALAMALGLLVENLLMIPLALAIAEAGQQQGRGLAVLRETASRMLRNPMIIAIVLGLAVSLLEWRLPVVAARVIEMLAGATAPVALFVIGASLNGLKVGGMVADVAQASVGKLLLHPLLMFVALSLMPDVDPLLMVAGLLFASAPMMSVFPILGQRFGLEERWWAVRCWPSSASARCWRCCAGKGCCLSYGLWGRFSGENHRQRSLLKPLPQRRVHRLSPFTITAHWFDNRQTLSIQPWRPHE